MTDRTKWIIYTALAVIAVLLVAIFSRNIVNGLQNLFVKIAIYLVVFAAGWLIGYFGGRSSRKPAVPAAADRTEAPRP